MIKLKEYIGKQVKVVMDRPLGTKHPKYDFIYPINYGFVPDTISGDGHEIDVYILGINESLKTFEGKCIAIIHRNDDDDDKLVVVLDRLIFSDEEILKQVEFQEKWFDSIVVR